MADITARASARLEPLAAKMRTAASDPVKSPRTAVVIGRLLGAAIVICFATGVYSHLLQHPISWLPLPTRPAQLYRVTQGIHVIVGTAAIPLVLAKLWTVYRRLFEWPPVRGPLHAIERAMIGVLVAATLLQLTMGLLNTFQWYPWPFSFTATHYVLAWVIIGSIAIHVGVKLPIIVRHWTARGSLAVNAENALVDERPESPARDAVPEPIPAPTTPSDAPDAVDGAPARLSRRALLWGVGASTGAIALLTAGQTIPALSPVNALAPRRMDIGPQGLPINRTAMQAGVTASAKSPDWALEVVHNGVVTAFTLAELRALDETAVRLPIACVEGWSQNADWKGVRMAALLNTVGAPAHSDLVVHSLQKSGPYRSTEMAAEYAADPLTLVALELNGSELDIEHGYPARVIAPGRPGVLQTKWLSRIEVV